jgi:hypothetical protein
VQYCPQQKQKTNAKNENKEHSKNHNSNSGGSAQRICNQYICLQQQGSGNKT